MGDPLKSEHTNDIFWILKSHKLFSHSIESLSVPHNEACIGKRKERVYRKSIKIALGAVVSPSRKISNHYGKCPCLLIVTSSGKGHKKLLPYDTGSSQNFLFFFSLSLRCLRALCTLCERPLHTDGKIIMLVYRPWSVLFSQMRRLEND